MRIRIMFAAVVTAFAAMLGGIDARAQAGFNDDRVMIEGFYWESCRHGHPKEFPEFGDTTWYAIIRERARSIREGRFDLVWLPPPCYSGSISHGYNPKEYFNLNNSYGSFDEHREMLVALLTNGVEPVADLVLNHRDGTRGWADFTNPVWGVWAICQGDEAFTNPASEVCGAPVAQRGAQEESPPEQGGGSAFQYGSYRDIDHTNPAVRRDILRYMLALRSMGYRGWRYDMVHGYSAKWVALYNRVTTPTFSVGEYDWGKNALQRGWVWYTATDMQAGGAERLKTSSSAFDFASFFSLKDNKGKYAAWYGYGNGVGMIGDTTDGLPWKNRAVTFVENHDTGYRTKDDGSPECGHRFDSFANNWEVEQAYAYVLTHPGVPCVYWKHYFDWGMDLQNKIRALVNARKVAGVNSGSQINPQNNALAKGVYAAMIEGRNGRLYVRIGGGDGDWTPTISGYGDYREYAHGAGWKVWVAIPGKLEVVQAELGKALPVPAFRKPEEITVPDEWLN